ncbi:MAG: tRNA (adenine-N1)-methyltransferase [Asgard group archaeon]|nr:tRNA (adenine-N1)-methyltransferase [Asgard group archaeon]
MKITEGDLVLISASPRKKWMVKVEKDKEFHTHKGGIKLGDLIGREFGSQIESTKGERFFIWKPIPQDYHEAVKHSTQVIYPTDLAQIIFGAGICSGKRVIEAGTGSGGLTCVLARYVQPNGMVYSYDNNPKHQEVAITNIEKLGLRATVNFKIRDVTTGFDESDVDAVILDLPTPWEVIEGAKKALIGGGILLCFVPTYKQVDQTVEKLKKTDFYQIDAFEVIKRKLTTKIGAIRPVTRMIGFTAFQIIARKGIKEE